MSTALHHKLIDTPEKIENLARKFARYRFASASITADTVQTIATEIYMFGDCKLKLTRNVLVDMHRANQIVAATLLSNVQELDPSQLQTIDAISSAPQSIHILSGGAGTGKSLLTRMLITFYAHKGVVLTASTATAAKLLSPTHTSSVHSAFQLNGTSNTISPFTIESMPLNLLVQCHVFITDEYSMRTAQHF